MQNNIVIAIIITLFIISVLLFISNLKVKKQNEINKINNEQENLKLGVRQKELDVEHTSLTKAQDELHEEKKVFDEYKKNKEDEYFLKLDQVRELKVNNDVEFRNKMEELNTKLAKTETLNTNLETEINNTKESITTELLKVTNLDEAEAKDELFKVLRDNSKKEYVKEIKRYKEEIELTKQELSREIVMESVENIAVECSNEAVFKPIKLPNDDIKGKLIGREGRNIRLIENLLGINVLIDDTPGLIGISCFNSTRRHIGSEVIEKLLASGKINQVVIEETVEKTKNEVEDFMLEKGKEAIYKYGITEMNVELVKQIGQLYFRASYGQNVYLHTLEAASISYKLAKEFNMDPVIAARCALLHDIGKIDSVETGESHVDIGVALARQYDESQEVIDAIAAHHDDVEVKSYYGSILQIADRISAGREGIRKESYDQYIKRVTALENLALQEDGVLRAFALQGARELRIIVESRKIKDEDMAILANDLKVKIANNLTFPGKIKINVIREVKYITNVSNKIGGNNE